MEVKPWPPIYKDEMTRRIRMVMKMNNDLKARAQLMAFYKKNPKAFINDLCITYNPRVAPPTPRTMPFVMFPKQEDFIDFLMSCIRDKENGLVEKARDIGATWLCCAFAVWMFLFEEGSAVGFGSRKELLVHRLGDPDSIFEKIRMIFKKLPPFILPAGFDERQHLLYMKFINPENGAVITGEAGTNIGRGGRKTIYFKDESAHYEQPEAIEAALGDNTDVQIDISSVNGTGNVFHRRRQSGEIWEKGKTPTRGKVRVFIFDWRDHPSKTQEWYDMRRKRADEEGLLHLFAQEVDRDYAASVEGIVIPAKWVEAAVDAHIHLNFTATGEKLSALDVADEGGDKNAQTARHGVVMTFAEDWGEGDTGDTARRAVDNCALLGINEFYYESPGVGAGVKSETNRLKEGGLLPPYLMIMPWNPGGAVMNPDEHIIPGDDKSPKNDDFFLNLKAQSWWSLRTRFEKTYKCRYKGAVYPPEELISLPSTLENLQKLKQELSQVVYKKMTGTNKVQIDKKPDGTKSPNLADSTVILYNPTRVVSILDVVG